MWSVDDGCCGSNAVSVVSGDDPEFPLWLLFPVAGAPCTIAETAVAEGAEEDPPPPPCWWLNSLWYRTSSSTFSRCFLDMRPNFTAGKWKREKTEHKYRYVYFACTKFGRMSCVWVINFPVGQKPQTTIQTDAPPPSPPAAVSCQGDAGGGGGGDDAAEKLI